MFKFHVAHEDVHEGRSGEKILRLTGNDRNAGIRIHFPNVSGQGNSGDSVADNNKMTSRHKGELKAKVTQKFGLLVEVPVVIQMGNLCAGFDFYFGVLIEKIDEASLLGEITFEPKEDR